jgi:hypothetical protein
VKSIFRKNKTQEERDLALLEYRNTPVKDLGVSPAQLMFNTRLRIRISVKESLLQPKLNGDFPGIMINERVTDQILRQVRILLFVKMVNIYQVKK